MNSGNHVVLCTWNQTAKALITGALGYFISPLDAIPDLISGVGYTDDIGGLTSVITMVAIHIKKEGITELVQKGPISGNTLTEYRRGN